MNTKLLIAAGVGALLVVAQTAASAAAGGALSGTVEAEAGMAPASAPVAVARAYSNAPARPLMTAGEAGALSASSVAVPVVAEVNASGMIAAVSRVPDRVAPSYNASLNASTTQGTCVIETSKVYGFKTEEVEAKDEAECQSLRSQAESLQGVTRVIGYFVPAAVIATVVIANDDPESD